MTTSQNIMVLVANGLAQMDYISLQRAFMNLPASMTLVSSEKNLVNGFNGNEWGLTFPVDQQIDDVLGSDFDGVIVLGGEQSVKRLQASAHLSRIMDAFMESGKPVVLMNEAQTVGSTDAANVMIVDGEITDENIGEILSHVGAVVELAQAA